MHMPQGKIHNLKETTRQIERQGVREKGLLVRGISVCGICRQEKISIIDVEYVVGACEGICR